MAAGVSAAGNGAGRGKDIAEVDESGETDAGAGSTAVRASGRLPEPPGGEFSAASLRPGGGASATPAGCVREEPEGTAAAAESGAAGSRGAEPLRSTRAASW